MALSILYVQNDEPMSAFRHQFQKIKIGKNWYWSYVCFLTQIDEQLCKDFFKKKKKGIFRIDQNSFGKSDDCNIQSFLKILSRLKVKNDPYTKHIEAITAQKRKLYYRID